MLEKMIAAALRNRLLVVLLFLVAFGGGLWALVNLPVDAFPDMADEGEVALIAGDVASRLGDAIMELTARRAQKRSAE